MVIARCEAQNHPKSGPTALKFLDTRGRGGCFSGGNLMPNNRQQKIKIWDPSFFTNGQANGACQVASNGDNPTETLAPHQFSRGDDRFYRQLTSLIRPHEIKFVKNLLTWGINRKELGWGTLVQNITIFRPWKSSALMSSLGIVMFSFGLTNTAYSHNVFMRRFGHVAHRRLSHCNFGSGIFESSSTPSSVIWFSLRCS